MLYVLEKSNELPSCKVNFISGFEVECIPFNLNILEIEWNAFNFQYIQIEWNAFNLNILEIVRLGTLCSQISRFKLSTHNQVHTTVKSGYQVHIVI